MYVEMFHKQMAYLSDGLDVEVHRMNQLPVLAQKTCNPFCRRYHGHQRITTVDIISTA